MSRQITFHFNQNEFDCHDGTPYPDEWVDERLIPLCNQLEVIRHACGDRPLTILSGYRTPAHNAECPGAAKDSQHMQGKAADIQIEGMAPSDVHRIIIDLDDTNEIVIGGLGLYTAWCHVDVRDRATDGHLAMWSGPGA